MVNKGTVVLKEGECYCKICGALTEEHYRRDLSVRRIIWLCPDCWNKTFEWSDAKLRRVLRKPRK